MARVWIITLVAGCLVVAGRSVGRAAAAAQAASAEAHVNVTVKPARAKPTQSVRAIFVTKETLDGTYHAQAQLKGASPGAAAACSQATDSPTPATGLGTGTKVTLKMRPQDANGNRVARWCKGSYKVTLAFVPKVVCPPTVQCGPPAAIPIGSGKFQVVGAKAKAHTQ